MTQAHRKPSARAGGKVRDVRSIAALHAVNACRLSASPLMRK